MENNGCVVFLFRDHIQSQSKAIDGLNPTLTIRTLIEIWGSLAKIKGGFWIEASGTLGY